MNISYSLDQYADTCRDAIKKSSAKLNESFENLLVEILLLYMIIPRKINFTQMGGLAVTVSKPSTATSIERSQGLAAYYFYTFAFIPNRSLLKFRM